MIENCVFLRGSKRKLIFSICFENLVWSGEAALKNAKRDLQARLDLAASATKAPRKVNWGPWEFIQCLTQAADHMVNLQEKKDFILRATLANQLLVFRPDAEGNLICIDDDPVLKQHGIQRNPPTRGLRPVHCEARIDEARARGFDTFPKPSWEELDVLGDYRQVAPPFEDANPEDFLQLPAAQLDLTEQQLFMLRPIQERVEDLKHCEETMNQVVGQASRLVKQRAKVRRRWSGILGARMFGKHSAAWRRKLEDSGRDLRKFARTHTPVVRGAKALRNLGKKSFFMKNLKTNRAQANLKSKADPPLVKDQDVPDHPYIGQEARVVAQGHQLVGLLGSITKVYRRTLAPGVPPHDFVVLAMKNNLQHLALGQVILVKAEQDQGMMQPAPVKLNYRSFKLAAQERHKVILNIQGRTEDLEFAQAEETQEMTTVHCGMLEILARLQEHMPESSTMSWLSPSEAASLAHMKPGEDVGGSNLEALTTLRSQLDSGTLFFTIPWAPSHYVLVIAERNAVGYAWARTACHRSMRRAARRQSPCCAT